MNQAIPKFSTTCSKCRDSGWFQAIHKENGCRYSFRCGFCRAADRAGHSAKITIWIKAFETEYEPIDDFEVRKGWIKKEAGVVT
jgi:hypothetical protein